MKKQLLGLALLALANSAMAQDANTLRIKGQLDVFTDSVLVYHTSPKNVVDTIALKDGKMDFAINLDKPQMIQLASPAFARGEQQARQAGQTAWLVGVPGETMEISGDELSRLNYSGSEFYKQYGMIDCIKDSFIAKMNKFQDEYRTRLAAGENKQQVTNDVMKKMEACDGEYKDAVLDFVKNHPDYEASTMALYELEDYDRIMKALGFLSERVREGRMKDVYSEFVDNAKKAKESEEKAAKLQAAGVEAPDFTLNDINGKPLTLSSLRGKVVVLDFWGSWCGWCIKGMPNMKEYYAKYKGKLEILGIDCNETQEKWKAAVAKHELPWLHVYNPRGAKNDVCQTYAINGFPTKIIIGADGKIVKTVVGEDPEFYTILDSLFEKK